LSGFVAEIIVELSARAGDVGVEANLFMRGLHLQVDLKAYRQLQ
jgi:hypothetical protein